MKKSGWGFLVLAVMITSVFCIISCANATPQDDAKNFNAQGYELYLQGKYEEALPLFEKAFTADPNNSLAHYNYACTLGALMKIDYPTWFSFKEAAIEHLKLTVKLDRASITKIKKDKDLEVLHKEFHYYRVIGLSTDRSDDVREILCSLTWYVHGEGVFAVLGGMQFIKDVNKDNTKDGTFKIWFHSSDFFENPDTAKDITYTGKFSVNGNRIEMKLDKPMLRKRSIEDIFSNKDKKEKEEILKAKLKSDGSLEFEGFEYKMFSWFDEFSA